ncbi:hypothetical protein [Mycobacterium sp. M26]|uniref:hypothetical protein n=1 Tax=Mycobacterium sp. M26 TaxID=1762962 RepID=UPI00336A8360
MPRDDKAGRGVRTTARLCLISYLTHSLPTTSLHTGPGGAGFTVGENELLPPGPTAFSVGDTDGADVDVVVLVAGASFSLGLQAVSAPIPTIAAPPAKRAI